MNLFFFFHRHFGNNGECVVRVNQLYNKNRSKKEAGLQLRFDKRDTKGSLYRQCGQYSLTCKIASDGQANNLIYSVL